MSRARAVARTAPAPRHPRRVSGPVARPTPVPGSPRPSTPVTASHNMGATLRALPDHRLLDTLLRSRAWIWLLGIALGGIVFMQVSLLGMNNGIGNAVAQSTELEHANALLSQEVAELSSGELIRAEALTTGLISPDAGDVSFLTSRGDVDAERAIRNMTAPSETALGTETAAAAATAVAPEEPVVAVETVAPVAPVAPVEPVAPEVTAAPVVEAAPTVAPVETAAAPPTEYTATGAATAP